MKVPQAAQRFLFSAWSLAVIPALFVIYFLPGIGKRHEILSEHLGRIPDQILFADLNGDSITECIHAAAGQPFNPVLVLDNHQNFYDQWNVPDFFTVGISEIAVGNFDNDRYSELYIFTTKSDSVFLSINEFFDPGGTQQRRVFITTLKLVEGAILSNNLKVCGFFDHTGDGKSELYFGITSGFGLEPRLLYRYDIEFGKIIESPFTGVNINKPCMKDVDGDNVPEIMGESYASGNYHTQTPYSDYSAWLMVFTDDLKLKSEPVEFPGFGSVVETKPFRDKDQSAYLVAFKKYGADTVGKNSRIGIYNVRGELVKEKHLSEFNYFKKQYFVSPLDENRAMLVTDRIHLLNENLESISSRALPSEDEFSATLADLTGDKTPELLLYTDQQMLFFDSDLQLIDRLTLELPDPELKIYHRSDSAKNHTLFVRSGERAYFLHHTKNQFYWLGYFAYAGIYGFFIAFIVAVRKINTYQISKKENLKRRLLTMQLQSIKGQLDPHFTFNALNSVASLLYLEDRNLAYDSLNKFTELLRQTLNDAERIYRPLSEELEFVKGYLSLEKLRFGEKLQFRIEIGHGVTQQEQVPKLVLQTFAENAIKHGLLLKKTGGLLILKVEKEKDYLKLTIIDNGVGREKAGSINSVTGKGLRITSDFYDILNQINNRSIRHTITDLRDDQGAAAGTKVEVWVPVVFETTL